ERGGVIRRAGAQAEALSAHAPALDSGGVGLPSAQIQPGENRAQTGVLGRGQIRGRVAGRQFLDADVAELDRRSFGFEREIALAIIAILTARNFLAVHAQAKDAVGANDAVMVPFGRSLAAFFGGETAVP